MAVPPLLPPGADAPSFGAASLATTRRVPGGSPLPCTAPAAQHAESAKGRGRLAAAWARAHRHRWEVAALGTLGLVIGALFGRVVVPGVVGIQRDTLAFYYPLTAWFAEELKAGRFALWCPLIFGGYPLVADGEIGALYPPNLLGLLVLPTPLAFALLRAAHYLVAAVGTYALARVLGVGRPAAAFAGVAFGLGAFMVGHLDHGNILRTAAWIPATFACAEAGLRARGRRAFGWTALGGATLALAGLGLHPQILLIGLVGLWVYAPARALALVGTTGPVGPGDSARATRSPRAMLGRLALVLGGISGLGLGGAVVQLAATYELGLESARGGGVPYAQAAAGALSPFDLATLVLPSLFRTDSRQAWSLFPYWETTLYVGVVGLVLALVGLALGRRRTIGPLFLLGGVGLALAMADNFLVDLYGLLWQLPGFSSMRMPGRYTLLIELALAVLAGIGLDRLLVDAGRRRARLAVLAIALVGAGLVGGGAALAGWVAADADGSLALIRDGYLAHRRDGAPLDAERVRRGLLAALDVSQPATALSLAAGLGAIGLLAAWAFRPARGRRWQAAVVALGVGELLLVAHAFHPTVPLDTLDDATGPLRFLRDQPGEWRAHVLGRTDAAITSRPALFGIAQAYGYSSLPPSQLVHYWTRVNDVEDDLLDLWNIRYVVEYRGLVSRVEAQGILFVPGRPLVDATSRGPLGHEAFRVAPTPTDRLRLLGALDGGAELATGETVAVLTVEGGGAPPETLLVRAGRETGEGRPGEAAHARPPVGHVWRAMDANKRVHHRDVFVAELPLATPRIVERVVVRVVARTGTFRLQGLGLVDGASGKVDSVLASHREKYAVAYQDDRATIYENRDVLPRAFVVPRATVVPPDEWAIVNLTDGTVDPLREVLIERAGMTGRGAPDHEAPDDRGRKAPASPGVDTLVPADGAATLQPAAIEIDEPDRVVVRASAPAGGYLVLSDAYAPGWRARIDGRDAPVERANTVMRAVALPPGDHVVELRFAPTSFAWGASASAVAWVAMGGLAFAGFRRSAYRPSAG